MNNITPYAKIVGKAVGLGFLAFIVSAFFTLIFFLIACYDGWSLFNEYTAGGGGGMGHAGAAGVLVFVLAFVQGNIASFILFISAVPLIGFHIFNANKIAISSVIHQIWKKDATELVTPKIIDIAQKVVDKATDSKILTDENLLRLKLIRESAQDTKTKGLLRRVIKYLVKKSGIEKLDFLEDREALPRNIANKVTNYVSEFSKPSWYFVWLVIIIQFILFITSFFL